MSKKASKFYVIWHGKKTGIFDTWAEAQELIKGVEGAQYKSYTSLEEAQKAFKSNYWQAIQSPQKALKTSSKASGLPSTIVSDSIAVDAACAGNPGKLEYQGVETTTKKVLFSMGPYPKGTVNIGEFLALVHGLAFLKKHDSSIPIYSDSKTAISWIKNKQIKTNLERNAKTEDLFVLVDRAIAWLQTNTYKNKILKWETEQWGENPADYGRK
jgi:ribonuclease HI